MAGQPRIGCFIYNGSTFWSMIAHGVAVAAEEFGASVEVLSARDSDGQDAILSKMIAQRLDAIVAGMLDLERGARSARAAAEAGIPLIAVVAEMPRGVARTTVRVDDIGGARLGGERLAQHLGGRGAVAHMHGPLGMPTAAKRAEGFRAGLASGPGVRIVYEGEGGDWSYEAGLRLAREALAAHPDLAGVVAASDSMALAAIDAAAEAGRTLAVVGFDGQPEGLAAVHAGRMLATVDQPAFAIGRSAGEAAGRLLRGEPVPEVITLPSRLIARDGLLDAAMQTVQIMPGLFHSLLEGAEAQRRLQDEIIQSQGRLIQELSAPILPLADDIVALPLVGTIDSLRANRITELLLESITRTRARAVIVDISGVPVVDTGVANHLLRAAAAARLLGTTMFLVGVSPEIAQTMVQLGIDLSSFRTCATMRDGLAQAQAMVRRGR